MKLAKLVFESVCFSILGASYFAHGVVNPGSLRPAFIPLAPSSVSISLTPFVEVADAVSDRQPNTSSGSGASLSSLQAEAAVLVWLYPLPGREARRNIRLLEAPQPDERTFTVVLDGINKGEITLGSAPETYDALIATVEAQLGINITLRPKYDLIVADANSVASAGYWVTREPSVGGDFFVYGTWGGGSDYWPPTAPPPDDWDPIQDPDGWHPNPTGGDPGGDSGGGGPSSPEPQTYALLSALLLLGWGCTRRR